MEIITKELDNFSSIRIILFNEKEWFFAKDTAEILGYIKTRNAIAQHCKKALSFEELFGNSLETGRLDLSRELGNNWKQTKLIPESDVWRLIIKSRLPEAEKIEEWIMEEVLPQIRKTGSYSIPKTEKLDLAKLEERAKVLEISQQEFIVFEDVFFRLGIDRKEELAITTNRAVKKETGVDFLEIAEKKGLSTPEKYFTVTELCQIVMNGDFSKEAKKLVSTKKGDKPRPQNLNKLLEKLGFQFREDELWKATEKGEKFSDFQQNKSKYSEKTIYHTVWKKEVLNEIL
jgi:prophage antirepressor-like protein